MIKWLKKMLCNHDWKCQGDVMSGGYTPWFKCSKCGKVESL